MLFSPGAPLTHHGLPSLHWCAQGSALFAQQGFILKAERRKCYPKFRGWSIEGKSCTRMTWKEPDDTPARAAQPGRAENLKKKSVTSDFSSVTLLKEDHLTADPGTCTASRVSAGASGTPRALSFSL